MTIRNHARPDEDNSEPRRDFDAPEICCRSACAVCVLDLPAGQTAKVADDSWGEIESVETADDLHLLALIEAFERAESMVEQLTARSRQSNNPESPNPNTPIKEATHGG